MPACHYYNHNFSKQLRKVFLFLHWSQDGTTKLNPSTKQTFSVWTLLVVNLKVACADNGDSIKLNCLNNCSVQFD